MWQCLLGCACWKGDKNFALRWFWVRQLASVLLGPGGVFLVCVQCLCYLTLSDQGWRAWAVCLVEKLLMFLSAVIARDFCLGKLFSPGTIIHWLFSICVKWDVWKLDGILYLLLFGNQSLIWFYSWLAKLSNLAFLEVSLGINWVSCGVCKAGLEM